MKKLSDAQKRNLKNFESRKKSQEKLITDFYKVFHARKKNPKKWKTYLKNVK